MVFFIWKSLGKGSLGNISETLFSKTKTTCVNLLQKKLPILRNLFLLEPYLELMGSLEIHHLSIVATTEVVHECIVY
jgi:hypothetical protein